MSNIQPSLKNTKQEILDAYEQAMQLLSQKDNQSQAILPTQNSTQTKSKPFDPQSPEEIINKAGELKLGLNKILGNLVDDLTSQSQQLSETKSELENAKKELEEVFKIKQTATTLQNLLSLHQDKKLELEKEIDIFRVEFETEQEQKQKIQKEIDEANKLKQKREQDEYDYNLKLARKKETDEYELQKLAKVKDLETRELELKNAEKELQELRKLAGEFESKIVSEIQKATNKSIEETKKELEIAYNLERKDVDMNTQLAYMTITNLQKTISAQESDIIDLKKQLITATQQVKDIALKVIEVKPNIDKQSYNVNPNN